jgi:hypothetical protein
MLLGKINMEIKLTPKESEEYFFIALCNGLGYIESGYGLDLRYDNNEYSKSAQKLRDNGTIPCYEDVIMQLLLDGNEINLYDMEGEEDHKINLKDIHDRIQNVPANRILEMINETHDADTADVILQTAFFNQIIFG